jgi:hypothetical protein
MIKLKRAGMVGHVDPTGLLIEKMLPPFFIIFIGSNSFDERAHFR